MTGVDAPGALDRSGEMGLVLTTLPDVETAERVVRTLLEERMIACGNIIPGLISLYWWDDRITRDGEVLVLLKARTAAIEQLFGRLAAIHPYDVPELVELPVAGVARTYCRWIMESTRMSA